MALYGNRTQFPNFENDVFHVYPNAGAPRGLKEKYGRRVYRWGTGDGAADAIAKANPGDTILFWPGTYTITSTINVNRPNITIRSANGNRNSVVFDASAAAGADIVVFTIAAAADYTILRDMTVIGDDSATPVDAIKVSGEGTIIENMMIRSATAVDSATNPAISLEDDADHCIIRGCWIKDHQVGIQLNAAEKAVIEDNFIISSDDAAIGVDALGVCSFSIVRNNTFYLRGGTGDVGVKVNNVALDISVINNIFHEDCADPISPGTQAGNADTIMAGNVKSGGVATDFTVTNSTVIQNEIFT